MDTNRSCDSTVAPRVVGFNRLQKYNVWMEAVVACFKTSLVMDYGRATAVGLVPPDRPNVCLTKFGPLSVACRVCLLHKVKIWTLLAELTFP